MIYDLNVSRKAVLVFYKLQVVYDIVVTWVYDDVATCWHKLWKVHLPLDFLHVIYNEISPNVDAMQCRCRMDSWNKLFLKFVTPQWRTTPCHDGSVVAT